MKLTISLVDHILVTLARQKHELTVVKLTVRELDGPKKHIWNIAWLGGPCLRPDDLAYSLFGLISLQENITL